MIPHEEHSLEPDPIEAESVDFDWQSLYDSLGESTADLNERDCAALAIALHEILKFVTNGELTGEDYEQGVARRMISLAWVVTPSLFADNPSLTKLAAALGMEAPEMSPYTTAVSKHFGIVNHAQAHGWNRK